MADNLTFHFEGALAEDHKMNFYEAARFQYAAARLMVKLAQFRVNGSFVKKITNTSNFNILLTSQTDGSFNINVNAPEVPKGDKKFIDANLTDLLSYVSERLIEKADEDAVKASANAGSAIAGDSAKGAAQTAAEADAIVEHFIAHPNLLEELAPDAREIVEIRIAELARQHRLAAISAEIAKIDGPRQQKLLSMSAPLVSEMATALRRSANTLKVVSTNYSGDKESILYLNKRIAQSIETAKVDSEITPILCDITQYNKESGWGKVRIDNSNVVGGQSLISFNIPSDVKSLIQVHLIEQMKKEKVYLQTYFVRDKGNEVIRLIVVGILPLPD